MSGAMAAKASAVVLHASHPIRCRTLLTLSWVAIVVGTGATRRPTATSGGAATATESFSSSAAGCGEAVCQSHCSEGIHGIKCLPCVRQDQAKREESEEDKDEEESEEEDSSVSDDDAAAAR